MEIKVRYHQGVFQPLAAVDGIQEGEELEIHLERWDWQALAQSNPSFDFLQQEPDVYTEEDIVSSA